MHTSFRQNSPGSARAEPRGPSSADIGGMKGGPAELTEVSSEEDWQKFCGDGFKGLCAIAFMGSPAGADPADSEALSVFKGAIEAMELTAIYHFIWIDASCQTKLAETFEVTGGATPALAVYSPLKNRFAKYVGSYAKVSLRFR